MCWICDAEALAGGKRVCVDLPAVRTQIMFQTIEETEARVQELEDAAAVRERELAAARAAVQRLEGERNNALERAAASDAQAAERERVLGKLRSQLEGAQAQASRVACELEEREKQLHAASERFADSQRKVRLSTPAPICRHLPLASFACSRGKEA